MAARKGCNPYPAAVPFLVNNGSGPKSNPASGQIFPMPSRKGAPLIYPGFHSLPGKEGLSDQD
jgi:hypothetical protein